MRYIIATLFLVGLLFVGISSASACQIQTIVVNGEIQTWQVCCNGYGPCIVTRIM